MTSAPRKENIVHNLIFLFVVAFAVRLAVNWFITGLDFSAFADEKVFTAIASNLLSGNGYSMDGQYPSAHRPPGFPLLLALVFSVFGKNLVFSRLLGVFLSALTVCLIYLLTTRLFGSKVGLIAAVAAVLNPFFVVRVPVLLYSDAFYLLLLAILLYLFLRIQETDSAKVKVACGILVGLTILTRSEVILFSPFIVLWAFLYHHHLKKGLFTAALILLLAVLVVSPWLIRNYMVFGKVMMATNFGCVLWGVYNPITFSDPKFMGNWEMPESPCLIIGRPNSLTLSQFPGCAVLSETEWDETCASLAVASLKQNYKRLPRLLIYKLRNLVSSGGAVENLFLLPFVYCFFFGLILLIASGDKRFLILYMFLLFIVLTTILFYTVGRLRMPFEMMMIIIGSYGLCEQLKLIRERRLGRRLA